jgi:hypothetical protein
MSLEKFDPNIDSAIDPVDPADTAGTVETVVASSRPLVEKKGHFPTYAETGDKELGGVEAHAGFVTRQLSLGLKKLLESEGVESLPNDEINRRRDEIMAIGREELGRINQAEEERRQQRIKRIMEIERAERFREEQASRPKTFKEKFDHALHVDLFSVFNSKKK